MLYSSDRLARAQDQQFVEYPALSGLRKSNISMTNYRYQYE